MNNAQTILVIGDVMIDHYLWGKCERISPEAPVQVVDILRESTVLGGAGNVLNNLNALGAKVMVATVIGDDANGQEFLRMCDAIGVSTALCIEENGRKTSKKSRVIATHQQVVRFDSESKQAIKPDSETILLHRLDAHIAQAGCVVLSDYGKGVLTSSLCQTVIAKAKQYGVKVLVDPKGDDYRKYEGAYLLTPNKKEAMLASGITIENDQTLEQALCYLLREVHVEVPMITLSEEGIGYWDNGLHKIPTIAKEVYDVTGAGDTVLSALAYAFSTQKSLAEAVGFANAAAAVVVGKLGSATATLEEIYRYHYETVAQNMPVERIMTQAQMAVRVESLRQSGQKIVFTNGCFDILHAGHVRYLEEAKSFGDVLIVGLNSDASVKRLKGESRPINLQDDRAVVLSALRAVDYVVLFDEDTPYTLIQAVQPDILVKGGDYEGKEVVGSDIAKQTKLVQFIDGKSTTLTIAKIKDNQ